MYDVVCVGSALLDNFAHPVEVAKLREDEKTEVKELVVTTGGAGTNCAVSFARKGLQTALIAEVGKDLVAATIKEELVREGVDISMLSEVDGEVTGMSIILVSEDGGRSALIYRGASKMLGKEDIKWDQLRSQWLYISSLGGDLDLLEGLIGHGKTYDMKVAVNPGMAEIEALVKHESRYNSQEIFNGIEVLFMNREEAAALTELPLHEEAAWRGTWHIEGPHWVIVTDGKNGGVIMGEQMQIFYEAAKSKPIEETGAGDAFGSGVVYALMQGKDIETAIEWGKKQASSVISFMGAKKGLLTKVEIQG